MAQTMSEGRRNTWGLQHLQSFHHRINQHNDRIYSWSGVSQRLLAWTTLLQAKADWTSQDIPSQQSSIPLEQYTEDHFTRGAHVAVSNNHNNTTLNAGSFSGSEEDVSTSNDEGESKSIAEVAYDTINKPSYEFYLKSQAFTSRIQGLEYYSSEHNSMQMSFENLKDGQRINTELHALWAGRPNTLRFLRDPRALEDALQPQFARRILLHIRVYTATFFAQFIHLHRVAFEAFPATTDVQNAVKRIIGLTKEMLQAVPERRQSQTQSPSPSSSLSTMNGASAADNVRASGFPVALPTMMLWPLFLACTECDTSDRIWILDVLRSRAHANNASIAQTVYLLEEVLRRQDQDGSRVDHRIVKRELFDGDLNTIY